MEGHRKPVKDLHEKWRNTRGEEEPKQPLTLKGEAVLVQTTRDCRGSRGKGAEQAPWTREKRTFTGKPAGQTPWTAALSDSPDDYYVNR